MNLQLVGFLQSNFVYNLEYYLNSSRLLRLSYLNLDELKLKSVWQSCSTLRQSPALKLSNVSYVTSIKMNVDTVSGHTQHIGCVSVSDSRCQSIRQTVNLSKADTTRNVHHLQAEGIKKINWLHMNQIPFLCVLGFPHRGNCLCNTTAYLTTVCGYRRSKTKIETLRTLRTRTSSSDFKSTVLSFYYQRCYVKSLFNNLLP